MLIIPRPDLGEYNSYYQKYIDLVPPGDVLELLRQQLDDLPAWLGHLTEDEAAHRYAPGKWSIREMVGHLSDTERIFGYRALRISRNDATPLAGFDENAYVEQANAEQRTLEDLLHEWQDVRRASISLFRGMSEAMFARVGTANNAPISVRALVYITAGHLRHHVVILRERYGLKVPGESGVIG